MYKKSKRKVALKKDQPKFTINCRSFPSMYRDFHDVPVMCTEAERCFTNKCATCGWNPLVKAERLRKVYGDKKASEAVRYSESITSGVNTEYLKRWRNYKPRKEEPDDD